MSGIANLFRTRIFVIHDRRARARGLACVEVSQTSSLFVGADRTHSRILKLHLQRK
jgi:hypothetical protein